MPSCIVISPLPETKKPPNRGGLMIPFAIFDLMVPSGLALAPFGRKVAGQSSSQISSCRSS